MILCVSIAFSRETGKFGFFFKAGSSSSVGLTFNLGDRVTLRPSFGFSSNNSEYESESAQDIKEYSYSMDLGLFYHFLKKDHFTAYSGFEAGYTYRNRESETNGISIYTLAVRKSKGYRGNAILGFQYNFNKHLAVFGEIAFGLLKEKVDFDNQNNLIILAPTKSTSWGLSRSGFGIILYL
jgi:hypothetical protein